MRRLIAATLALAVLAIGGPTASLAGSGPAQRYIVVFSDEAATRGLMHAEDFRISRVDGARVGAKVSELRARKGIRSDRVFRTVLPGFSARLTPAQVAELRADPEVAYVVPDLPVGIDASRHADDGATVVTRPASSGQTLPTGIRRVRADASPIARIGERKRVPGNVAVLDTGIASHRDLVVAGGRNCTDSGGASAWADRHGHGTHVAGTIGARDNSVGVVGVAPGVDLWAVKVLGDDAKGWSSWIICGLDFVARKKKADGSRFFDVVNMSLSGPLDSRGECGSTSSPYQAATCRVVAAGIPVVVAAGNMSRDARNYRPAAYPNVITVSALADYDGKPGGNGRQGDVCPGSTPDADDTYASFSNFGPDVDLIAPGKCILSTYKGGGYALMSGTSMATPHVSGAVVLYRVEYPEAGPLQVKGALQAAGTSEWRTGTDPDGHPDPLLRVVPVGPPPTFNISIPEPVAWLGRDRTLRVPVRASRQNGHREPIRLKASDLPAHVSVLKSAITGSSGDLRLRSTTQVADGEHRIRVVGTDGELKSRTRLTLRIDSQPPRAAFTAPVTGSLRLTDRGAQDLSWTESDKGGSGLAGRSVQHQTAQIVKPGSCDGVTWADDGTALQGPSPISATSLAAGVCHRWRLSVRDGARNQSSAVSGSLLVDGEPPPRPTITATGDGTFQAEPNATTWFRSARSGSLSLRVRSVDPHSGTRDLSLTALDPSGGWSGPDARTSSGSQVSVTLSWSKGAPATSLRARATDRAGLVGNWRTLQLQPDETSPTSAGWTNPAAGSMSYSRGSVRLGYEGGSDTGSGLDPVATIAVRTGAAVSEGTCAGVTYGSPGTGSRLASGSVVEGLASGTCYRWVLTSHDRVGNPGASRTSGAVLVDGRAPTVAWTGPRPDGITYASTTRVAVTFSIRERGGSGLAGAEVRRQAAQVTEPGSCSGATWSNDGTATPATSGENILDERGLLPGYCYRWQVKAIDRAGNERLSRSSEVLVDTGSPPVAQVSVPSGGAWSESAAGPIWFRAGVSGSFVVRSEPAEDDASGIAGSRFGAVSPTTGWSSANRSTVFVRGRRADRTFSHSASAGDATFQLTSRDRAGNHGPVLDVSLRADGKAPSLSIISPAKGTTRLTRDRVVLDFEARDGGSGMGSLRVQQQRARPANPDDCTSVAWINVGDPVTATPGMVVDDLKVNWCYRWRLIARDRVGNTSRAMTGAVRLDDGIVLDIDDIAVRLGGAQLTRTGSATGRLTWSVDTVLADAVVSHDVDATRDGGATWQKLVRRHGAARLDVRLEPRGSLVLAIRARDSDGHVSAWEESQALRMRLTQESARSISWSGRWRSVESGAASGGTLRRSSSAGASATFAFDGLAVAFVTELGPRAGTVDLRMDGSAHASRSLRRATTSARKVLVVATFAESGPHELEIVVQGDGQVAVDGFVVLRSAPTTVQR